MSPAHSSRRDDNGVFRRRPRPGIAAESRTEHRGFTFSVTSFDQQSGVARRYFNAAIYDSMGCRRAYLRGQKSLPLAMAAARDWIDTLVDAGKR